MLNEAETRAEYIDPKLKAAGWGEIEGSKVLREFHITDGKKIAGGLRAKADIADYILIYKNQKIAVVEAKSDEQEYSEGVGQAKAYAEKLQINYTYATNGRQIYQMSMKSATEGFVEVFPTPDELWNLTFSEHNAWKEKFAAVPFEDMGGTKSARYYQELAVNRTLDAIAEEKQRILLTLATGTGKTFIAFQIAWKLFQARWNVQKNDRRPRILFLADRNILANQAINDFSSFKEDARCRIDPTEIRKKGSVPTNASVFFTIFQTFMSGPNDTPYFGEYPPDFFDLIIIDECHRGGAQNESTWRGILEYFAPAVQLGLTATPKRKDNVDTYRYFGEPAYTYSLKTGINDGFLTPFKVKRIKTTMDDYVYTPDDEVVEGEVEQGKLYEEADFNRIIEIKAREEYRVKLMLSSINQNEKAIVFCASQAHAAAIRDLINQMGDSKNPGYCARVTAEDGARGDQLLADFKDIDKTVPVILTTSQKLSTGVDARNIRTIVLMRPVNSMIEFKQIVGRGTRLFDGKEYFTILDFVDAYKHFSDPEWDGEPIDETTETPVDYTPHEPKVALVREESEEQYGAKKKIVVKLRDGKEREIQHMISTSFWGADSKPVSAEEFLQNMFGTLPEFFKSEEELRTIWSDPVTRKAFLEKLAEHGYAKEQLEGLQKLVSAEDSDLFDVLAYVAFALKPITRIARVAETFDHMTKGLNPRQDEFLEFVLSKYIERGVDELAEDKLPQLLNLKYHAISDAETMLGGVAHIRSLFFGMQKMLYQKVGAQ